MAIVVARDASFGPRSCAVVLCISLVTTADLSAGVTVHAAGSAAATGSGKEGVLTCGCVIPGSLTIQLICAGA